MARHYEDLKQSFPEKYVAVYRHEVVDHDAEIGPLMGRLKSRYGADATSVAVEYISTKKDELIL